MRLIFGSHSANFPKIHAAIVQASAAHHCELPGLGIDFLLSFVRPKNHFLESRILVKNAKTLLFWAAAALPLVHQSMLLYYCPLCLPSESCQICKPFLLSSWFAQNPILLVAVFIQQNEPHETNVLLPLSQLPENPCCYSTGQCCSPMRTARARNRFPALVRSSVEPFFGISNFGQKRSNAPFLDRCCSATGAPIHAALLLPSLSF